MTTMSHLGNASEARLAAGLAEAVRSLTALGDAVEALTTQASPQTARAVQTTENLVRSVGAEFGLLGAAEAGERLGSASKAARNLAGSKHRSGDLLAIRRGNRDKFPGFQFDRDGSPRPVISELRQLATRHGWSESDLFLWLVTPAGSLDGIRPVDLILDESKASEIRVVAAAELEMSTEW